MIWRLILQGAVFLLWAGAAFRSLFRLRARAVEASVRAFPPPAAQIDAIRAGISGPAFAADRRRLLWLTGALLELSLPSARGLSHAL